MAKELHRLLERQLKKSGLDLMDSNEGRAFIENINKTYLQFANEFRVLEDNTERMLHKVSQTNDNLRVIIESLDSFNYHVSHDLKNTLINTQSLSNMAEKYLAKNDLNKVAEVLSKLILTSNSGVNLVEKFLQMSKFESRLLGQEKKKVDLPKLINDLVNRLKINNAFDFQFDECQFQFLECKELGVSSLFQNLLTNSIKYSKQDTGLRINVRLLEVDNRKVIHFKDNGIGIDLEENGDKLFKPFVRIENGLNQEGTGVGLFLVKKVMIEHGGTVKVSSELGNGTEFIITF